MKLCPECKRSYDDSTSFCVFDGHRLLASEDSDPFVGLVVDGKYHIDRRIAKGGSGNVYRATHIQLKAPVAVKIIHPRLVSDPAAVERFRREALVTMKVRHTNAIAVMDFGITNNHIVYVVTELLEGVTLEQRLREKGFLSPNETSQIMNQVCAAVAVVHENQIVHRDLKPENIFLHQYEGREVVKVVDFGIAKYKGNLDEEEEDMRLTQSGFVVGTPFYMSPEQCRGQDVDHRADIYSLGVMLYQVLTGKLPFDGHKASIIVTKHKTEKPKPIYEVKPGLPAVLNGVIMRALEKKPEDRQQNVLELAHELESAVKAITEQELKKVFLNATEDDLDAVLLLAAEPSPMTDSSTKLAKLFDSFTNRDLLESIAGKRFDEKSLSDSEDFDTLFVELLGVSKDLSTLLQLIIENLENRSVPSRSVFNELKTTTDQMRGLLFGIQKTHYKTLI
ncbi:MAG: serine/threonine protein kinase [Blastocatellia bacterium]|nr:serine/threonine protein kinase [Blastocatellia bacterium]